MSKLDFRFASAPSGGAGPGEVHWQFKRNCSVTPSQLAWMYLSLCLVSLGIASLFWVQGAKLVMPFAWVELVAVGCAFLVYARHAADRDLISLVGNRLVVELENAGQLIRAEFNRNWVRVEPVGADRSLIELYGQGQRIEVGRFVRPELRPALAQEIRWALRNGGESIGY